jgi:hypothetical protein
MQFVNEILPFYTAMAQGASKKFFPAALELDLITTWSLTWLNRRSPITVFAEGRVQVLSC